MGFVNYGCVCKDGLLVFIILDRHIPSSCKISTKVLFPVWHKFFYWTAGWCGYPISMGYTSDPVGYCLRMYSKLRNHYTIIDLVRHLRWVKDMSRISENLLEIMGSYPGVRFGSAWEVCFLIFAMSFIFWLIVVITNSFIFSLNKILRSSQSVWIKKEKVYLKANISNTLL